MTKLPPNFSVTDSHREYCASKWGYPMIADTFLEAFKDHWLTGEGEGERKKNWDRDSEIL